MDLLENDYYESLIANHYGKVAKEKQLGSPEKNLFGISSQPSNNDRLESLKQEYLEPVFHHYLAKQREQQAIRFVSQNGNIDMVAEKGARESSGLGGGLADDGVDLPSLVEVDVAEVLGRMDIEREERQTRQMEELEVEYSRQIKIHNEGEDDDEKELILQEKTQRDQADSEMSFEMGGEPKEEVEDLLWIEKYTSSRFFDLLTDEALNRNVLTWLKSWDDIVFPEKEKVSLALPDSIMNQKGAMFQKGISFRKVDAAGNVTWQTADMEFCHQNKKLITLYGPPGTGKTTMARVLAKQCGYEARHINASDKRSAGDLIGAIKNALQQDSHFQKSGTKPVCLIVDEVDGAVSGGIGFHKVAEFLRNCIQRTSQAKGDDDEDVREMERENQNKPVDSMIFQRRKGTTRKNDNIFELQRPIIFICNDLYTKALRPLKEISLQVKIGESDPRRLISRLRQIASKEDLKIDDTILKDIAEQCNFDARSSINSLQFLAKKYRNKRITRNDVNLSNLYSKKDGGLKDTFTNIFNVTDQILIGKPQSLFGTQLIREVQHETRALGDYQLLNSSLFHNYSSVAHYFDDNMEKTAFFLDTLSRCELQVQYAYKTQHQVMAYQFQYMPSLIFKKYCANQRKEQVKHREDGSTYSQPIRTMYPDIFRKMAGSSKVNADVLDQLLDLKNEKKGKFEKMGKETSDIERFDLGHDSVMQSCLRKKDMMLDILPMVYSMIHPDVREINIQLFNPYEKEVFLKALELMVLFDIRIKQKTEDSSVSAGGQAIYTLPTASTSSFQKGDHIPSFEPDIAEVTTFGRSGGRRTGGSHLQFMRLKTQILLTQNYEKVKQAMLASGDTGAAIFDSKRQELKKQQEGTGTGRTLKSFMRNLQDQQGEGGGAAKKRMFDEISKSDPSDGRFRFKFQEGHSKNFKRELGFEWFLKC